MKNPLNFVLIIMLFLAGPLEADDKLKASDIFIKMKSLVGVWEKEGAANSDFNISFELTANDTVLIETWNYKGNKHSLTLYHLNGHHLMATHYCPQGNQPRLQLLHSSALTDVSFTYLDATNLDSLDETHQHSLTFDLSQLSNKIKRKETYLSKSGQDESELILVRKSLK